MIALSSHRPFEGFPEYALNQGRAAESWKDKFSQMYYIGHYEKELCFPQTLFVRPEGSHPTIKAMAGLASVLSPGYTAILNADIVLTEPILEVEKKMHDMALPAATSYRHEFLPEDYPNLDNAIRNKEDRGMDIFIATGPIWKMVEQAVPDDLLFGHNRWDSWVCGFFCHHLGYGFRHFTDSRCVFHPKHEGRSQPHLDKIKTDSPYFTRAKRPSLL